MSISAEFLTVLRCPVSGSRLTAADPPLVVQLNEAIAAGKLTTRGGEIVSTPLDEALLNEQRTLAYPLRNGIASLTAEAAIPTGAWT